MIVPFTVGSFLGNTALPQLRDSPRGSISVLSEHKDISDIINVERLCFIHWQFLGIEGAGGREKNDIQKILSVNSGLNIVPTSK